MSSGPVEPEPEGQMTFQGDQDDWDQAPREWKDHVTKAFLHKAGLGPHPGKYNGPQHQVRYDQDRDVHMHPTESDLAHERFGETPPPAPPPLQGPVPAQEQVQQPMPGGGKKPAKQKPPSGTTPTAIGAQIVKPPEPEGGY